MSRFVTVASFDETFRADIARSALEDAGIQVRITDREIVSMEWVLSTAVGGIKVQVLEADAVRARQLLDDAFRELRERGIDEDELARQALEAAPEDEVPPPPPAEIQAVAAPASTPATDDEREEYARRFLLAAVFGTVFLPLCFYACYLFLNAVFGPGRLSSEGWRRVLFGAIAAAFTLPLWFLVLKLGNWGVVEALTPDW